jgi:hypothetical protein
VPTSESPGTSSADVKIETVLSESYGLIPERHETDTSTD